MAKELNMPKLGNTVESVTLIKWCRDVGDAVKNGDVVCEVETDKATVEVESEADGILLAQLFDAGDEIFVQNPYAVLGEEGEIYEPAAENSEKNQDPGSKPESAPARPEQPSTGSFSLSGPESAPTPSDQPIKSESVDAFTPASPGVSPRAKNRAASAGITALPESGSGPFQRIIERDIEKLIKSPPSHASFAETKEFPGPYETTRMSKIREVIARRMHASLISTAQLTLNASADAASLLSWREYFKSSPENLELKNITVNDLILFATAGLLRRSREFNAHFTDGHLHQFQHVHLGFAVDTPKGLMVPVIRYADTMPLTELSLEARRLADACREGRIKPDEMEGGTFTVSNLGSLGVETFTPVLNVPQVAILGVGSFVNVPVETPEGVGIGRRIGLSLTVDHQIIDGAPGARFLSELAQMLSNMEWTIALHGRSYEEELCPKD